MKLLFIVSLLLIANLSCKKSHPDSQENKICFTRTSTELKIENNTAGTFYFIAMGRSILPVIDWIPVCSNNNNIPADSTIHKDFSTIIGYSDNDSIVVYWWKCNGNSAGQIQTVMLNKNQTACR